ncbi:MAG: hypothetical protein V5A43_02910 [Haloarculaceae archaeon]
MDIGPTRVADLAAEYRAEEPLAAVESDHVEMLPATFRGGEFGWRDAIWVVRWYYRRFLGAVPNAERRAAEDAFDENEFEAVRDAIVAAATTEDLEERLDSLTRLDGVDLPVATAFLQFIDPESFLVVGEREWGVLEDIGALSDPYPSPATAEDYRTYLEAARDLADRCDCDAWTLYQAIWRLAGRPNDSDQPTS